MRCCCCVIVAVSVLLCADAAQDDAAKKDLDGTQGSWKIVSMEENGKAVPMDEVPAIKLTVNGSNMSHPGSGKTEEATFKLDPSKKPKTIDITQLTDPNKGKTLLGIYSIEGDTLKICFAKSGGDRPTEFKAPKEGVLFVLKREVSADAAQEGIAKKEGAKLQGIWTVIALEAGGQKAPEKSFKEMRFLIEPDKISLTGNAKDLRLFRLVPAAKPKAMDISGDAEKELNKAIYEVEGDTLRLCFSQSTKVERPKDFNTAGTKFFCYTLKREKP